jgi:hypothetical protein
MLNKVMATTDRSSEKTGTFRRPPHVNVRILLTINY